jgi:hypothetical protein
LLVEFEHPVMQSWSAGIGQSWCEQRDAYRVTPEADRSGRRDRAE